MATFKFPFPHTTCQKSIHNLLERWTLFGVVWSFRTVRLRIMLIILEGTVKKMSKIQETPQDVEELPQCFWLGQQRLAPGLKCYALTHGNEVRFYPQEHNPSPFCSPLVFWEFFDRTPPPPLVTRHPLRSAMCQATFDFDLLPVFGALAAIQIMLKLRHRARHRVCLQTQVQCCSWHRHQPTITTFHHETHTGLVRKQAWALSFTWTYSTSKIHLYTFIIIYISYIFSRWNERSKDGQGMSHCNQLCYSCQSVNKKDMFCLSKYDYVNISPRA